jgi:uncharacterized damage-inducible protein DinB
MPENAQTLTTLFTKAARRRLLKVLLPRIESCLEMLSDQEIWWRPNEASNSIGNLVLHLTGNVRQWIIAGLGGAPDIRKRDLEFSERGPVEARQLGQRLHDTVLEAARVIGGMRPRELALTYSIQGYKVTGLDAAFHVVEHFSHHAGQIIQLTKQLRGDDLALTHLPREKKKAKRKAIPAV